jgi:DNA-binding NtrC family response regulator
MAYATREHATDSELGAPGRVLLVDDQPELRRIFRRTLVKLGHEVVEASNGRAAIALVRQQHFDVVLSDVRMPDMDGLELLQQLGELDAELPVVLVSGGLDAEAERAAAEYGAFDYLMKPLAFEKLQDSTARAIELRRRHAEARERYEPFASMKRLKIPAPSELEPRRKR